MMSCCQREIHGLLKHLLKATVLHSAFKHREMCSFCLCLSLSLSLSHTHTNMFTAPHSESIIGFNVSLIIMAFVPKTTVHTDGWHLINMDYSFGKKLC